MGSRRTGFRQVRGGLLSGELAGSREITLKVQTVITYTAYELKSSAQEKVIIKVKRQVKKRKKIFTIYMKSNSLIFA